MPVMKVGPGRALVGGGGETYDQKVLATGPIAYWPLWETAGVVAECLVSPLQNGTYSSNVATWPVGAGVGDGNTAPRFDGVADFVNVLTAPYIAAFNGNAGTTAIWAQVDAVGVWTDGALRYAYNWNRDGNNNIYNRKDNVNNQIRWRYLAGGVVNTNAPASALLTWMHLAITWDSVANEVRTFYNGAQVGAPLAPLGVWAGALAAATIGAQTPVPALLWQGGLAHCAVWNTAQSPAIIATLALV